MIETIGGVSPLKEKRQASRGGKYAGKATSTSGKRGGFARSKGKRGGGGRNVGGYNVQTRFEADKWIPPPSGGTTVIPMEKPYSYDPEGKLQVNPPGSSSASASASATAGKPGTPGSPGEGYWKETEKTTYQDLESYRKVWDKNDSDLQSKHKNLEEFATAADKWWVDESAKFDMSVEEFKNTYKKQKTEKGWIWVKTKEAVAGTAGTAGTSEAKAESTSSTG